MYQLVANGSDILHESFTREQANVSQKSQEHRNPLFPPIERRLQQAKESWATLFQQPRSNRRSQNCNFVLTQNNQQTNTPWGDPLIKKQDKVTRV